MAMAKQIEIIRWVATNTIFSSLFLMDYKRLEFETLYEKIVW